MSLVHATSVDIGKMRAMNHEGRARALRGAARHRRRYRVGLLGHPATFTVDVGAGGFCVELMRVLPTGTPLQGTILVEGSEEAFLGTVVWTRPGDPRINLRGRMGVQFTQAPLGFVARVESREPSR
jgi:hypothetical protein